MIYQELKRRLFTKFVFISTIGVFIITFGLNAILIRGEKNLIKNIKEESIYSGQMTEDKLWMGLEKVRDEKSKEIRYKTLVSYIYGLTSSYPGILYCETKVEDFKDTYAKDFYKCWKKKSIALIKKIPKNNQQKALKELNKVRTPFNKYPGTYILSLGLDNLQNIYIIILFMVTFFAAATYSDSIEDGSMEVIYATKLGNKLMRFRIIPVMIYGFILTLVATLTTVITLGKVTGFEVLNSSFKTIALFSIGNFTLKDVIILMSISQILGSIALASIMGWISYKTGKTNIAIGIGSAINIFYIITCFFMKISGKFFRIILNCIPMASSQIIYQIPGFRFDLSIWRPYAVMINMVMVFIIFYALLISRIFKEKS